MAHCILSAICFSALAMSAHGQAIGSASTSTSKPGALVTIPESFSERVPGTGKPGLGSPPLPRTMEPFGSTSTTSIGALGVSPGRPAAPTVAVTNPAVLEMLRDWAKDGWVPMRRLTTPADVGDAVALLCSEQAGFITGQIVAVDGGASLACADLPMKFQQG
jgi:Enoyl-(Acyl carrier protein) reductase